MMIASIRNVQYTARRLVHGVQRSDAADVTYYREKCLQERYESQDIIQ